MNLLTDPWLLVRDAQGQMHRISVSSLGDARYVDIVAVRPDFRGAVYQLLIAILQCRIAPVDAAEWRERYRQPPSQAELERVFAPWAEAFVLEADGPAFMQDLQLAADANRSSVLDLLIDAGSDSNLFFNKPGAGVGFCASCTAQALFTLQINAPSGGRGVRTSLRGGGPMTTLLVPVDAAATLWQRLWLNVIVTDALNYPAAKSDGSILPWLVPTRTSDGAGAVDTTPESVHPLQAYWSMPRRIRLESSEEDGECAICGAARVRVFRHYRTRHGGTNYTGAWQHPLTPYKLDPKHQEPPLSIKGQPGGIGYRDWLGLAMGRNDSQPAAAQVVTHYQAAIKHPEVRLWCFGYDMNNMKARCWYDSTLPVHVVDEDLRTIFIRQVRMLVDIAAEATTALHRQVKSAWFRRPGDVGSEPAIHQSFWQGSEPGFYDTLAELASADLEDDRVLALIHRGWLMQVRRIAMNLFEHWTLAGPIEDRDLERVVRARAALARELNAGKSAKEVWKWVNAQSKENA